MTQNKKEEKNAHVLMSLQIIKFYARNSYSKQQILAC